MKIQLLSDIHLERLKYATQAFDLEAHTRQVELRDGRLEYYMLNQTDADVIVFAGDVGSGSEGIEWAGREAKALGIKAVYVAGNHEFYRHEFTNALVTMRMAAKESGVYFLERDEVIIQGVRFLGCTLWTNFCAAGDKARSVYEIWRGLADFSEISVFPGGLFDHSGANGENRYDYRNMRPDDQIKLFEKSVSWLKAKLAESFDGKTVVVTHHGPSPACQHPRFPLGPTSAAFWSNLDELVEQVDLWAYGHTHDCLDTKVRGTRLVANQVGYPGEPVAGFNPNKVIQI